MHVHSFADVALQPQHNLLRGLRLHSSRKTSHVLFPSSHRRHADNFRSQAQHATHEGQTLMGTSTLVELECWHQVQDRSCANKSVLCLAFLWKTGFVWPPYPDCFRSYRLLPAPQCAHWKQSALQTWSQSSPESVSSPRPRHDSLKSVSAAQDVSKGATQPLHSRNTDGRRGKLSHPARTATPCRSCTASPCAPGASCTPSPCRMPASSSARSPAAARSTPFSTSRRGPAAGTGVTGVSERANKTQCCPRGAAAMHRCHHLSSCYQY